MKNWIEQLVNNYQRFSRAFVLFFSIFVVAMLMPQSSFNYKFEKDKPWQYEDLLAPFTFPVLKTNEQYQADIKSVEESFVPYYKIVDFRKTKIDAFRATMDLKLSEIPDSTMVYEKDIYYKLGEKIIHKVYDIGFLELAENHKGKSIIYIKNKDESYLKQVSDFYNSKKIAKLIEDEIFSYDDPIELVPIENVLNQILVKNVIQETDFNRKTLQNSLKNVAKYTAGLQKGQNIVTTGEIVNEDIFQQLSSLREEYNKSSENSFFNLRLLGYVLISGLCFFVLFYYLRFYEPWIYSSLQKFSFIFLLVVIFITLTKLIVSDSIESLNYYLIPFCILPILLRSFFQVGVFSYVYVITLVLTYFVLPVGYDFILLNLIVGYIAFESSSNTYYWSQFFTVVGVILLAYFIGYTGLELVRNNSLARVDYAAYPFLFANSMLTLLAYPLIPVFEKFFGFLSNITLVELGDLNKPLLRKLQAEAPGTMHHSLEVANLAENAAREIKADPLLVKVGALYHDIGKMNKPIYFIENQENITNPHDEISAEESAKIIIDHVIDGIELAKEANLPNILIDFIRTHHGETRVEYFYRKFKEENPEVPIDENKFTYPGPLPYSKETAILMLADSVEAATKSLKNPTGVEIDEFIDKIIDFKIAKNQLVNCNLSFKDLSLIRKTFKKILRSKYHIRIEYPKNKEK